PRTRLVDVMPQQPPDPIVRHPHQSGHVRHRHRLAQRDHECFHHQREAGPGPRPWRLDLTGLATCRTGHPGQRGMDERPELEEVQVLPASLDPVVDRLVGCTARRTHQPLGLALHRKVDGTLRLPEIHRNHRPWRTQTQCLCEESFHPGSVPPTSGSGKSDSTRNATDPKMEVGEAYHSKQKGAYPYGTT